MITIAIINQKGGVGKTTTTINVGVCLSQLGYKVLLVDMDPQGHLGTSLGLKPEDKSPSMIDVLTGRVEIGEITEEAQGCQVACSNLDLSIAETTLNSEPGKEFILNEKLARVGEGFDFCLIDCPPSLGILSLNALTTANFFLIPTITEYLPLQGVASLMQIVETVQRRLNPQLQLLGAIVARHRNTTALGKAVLESIVSHFGEGFIQPPIRENVAIAEAPAAGLSVISHNPDSHGARDYRTLTAAILLRLEALNG